MIFVQSYLVILQLFLLKTIMSHVGKNEKKMDFFLANITHSGLHNIISTFMK